MTLEVRPGRPEDGPALRRVERLAGQAFRTLGMDAVADDEPPSLDTLASYAEAERLWVAAEGPAEPVGYVVVDVVDGCAHVEQVSVRPDHQGTGVGRALLDRVAAWARARSMPALTLTTFADVPWNRPLYEHLGFRVLGERELSPGLRTVRDAEAGHGLDPTQRVCMRRDL
jgi:GNAT superfamily N-acetyltransferase